MRGKEVHRKPNLEETIVTESLKTVRRRIKALEATYGFEKGRHINGGPKKKIPKVLIAEYRRELFLEKLLRKSESNVRVRLTLSALRNLEKENKEAKGRA